MGKLANTEEFILKSENMHGNKYVYTNVNYINSRSKVCIICPTHGEFYQSPHLHVAGSGCILCCRDKLPSKAKSLKNFIEESNKIHGIEKYNYTKVEYKRAHIKVCIICPTHGEFYQSPDNHLHGHGCSSCAGQGRYGIAEFINRANKKHNNKFNYEKVSYKNLQDLVTIICPHHGEFTQHAGSHLRGNGCLKCASNSISKLEHKWLDSLNVPIEYRQLVVHINGKKIRPDAYNCSTNTIYEFNGDFWHGNPAKYNSEDVNPKNKKTFGELYRETEQRRQLILENGFKLVETWESDFKNHGSNDPNTGNAYGRS